jgi:hypothetical protein
MNSELRAYLEKVASPKRRSDAETLVALTHRATGEEPRLWGTVVGFGQYHCRYPSGREGDAPAAGFAARKAATTVYVADGVGAHADRLNKLGRTPPAWAASTSRTSTPWTWTCSTPSWRSYATLTGEHLPKPRATPGNAATAPVLSLVRVSATPGRMSELSTKII